MGREEDSTKVIRFDYNKMDLNGITEELRSCNCCLLYTSDAADE